MPTSMEFYVIDDNSISTPTAVYYTLVQYGKTNTGVTPVIVLSGIYRLVFCRNFPKFRDRRNILRFPLSGSASSREYFALVSTRTRQDLSHCLHKPTVFTIGRASTNNLGGVFPS